MVSSISRRPSPALIIAVVALVAALAGTAVAGPGASTSAITKSKVKKISSKQAGKQIQALLPIGSAELAVINTRTQSTNVPPNGFNGTRITANCQSGERIISGGIKHSNGSQVIVGESFKQGDGWEVLAYNFSAANQQVTVEAYCLAQI